MTDPLSIHFQRTLPVRHQVDVCVVGGGPAGIAAAVTAARQGRRVFLLEGQGCFGGMGTAAGLPIFCDMTDGVNFVAGGIGRDIYDRLWTAGGFAPGQEYDPPNRNPIYRVETLKRVYDDLVDESGAEFSLFTQFLDVETTDGRVSAVVCSGKSGLFAVQAEIFIDCTGDGDLCARAGAPFEKGDTDGGLMPGTLCSMWAGIDWAKANAAGHGIWRQEFQLPRAFADNLFTFPDGHLPGMLPVGRTLGGGNIGHLFGIDGTDERSLTQSMIWGRKLLLEYERFYKEFLTGYEAMELAATAAIPGVRETRRITGDYQLTVDDFHRRATFDDEIGRFSYPVDIHHAQPSSEIFANDELWRTLRYAPGETYGIPYRCLTPRGLSNVLVAGRPISADRYLHGSLRVMPGCFITGQAAGMAATLASEGRMEAREIKVNELQARLKRVGGYLPNCEG